MTALFDRPWQERLLDGDTEAALQLARSALPPLYEYCQRQLTDRQATQQVVRNTLVRAIHEIRNYDPEVYGNQIWDWVVALAALEREGLVAPHSTPRNASLETEVGLPWGPPPDAQFIYHVETDLCLEARRNRDASDEEVEPAKRSVRREEVAITCPECGHAYHISVTRLGHRMRCGHCDRTFEATAGDLVVPAVPPGPEQPDLPVSVVAPPLPHESPPDKRRIARKVPQKVARFEIRAHLGSGSFGDVFRAYDPVLDREVAIKLATSAALDNDRARPLVLQEPKAAANLRHPNIVAVHDAGFDGAHFYMAIDLIDGCTLREKLRHGSLDRDTVVQLVMSLAEALDYAHRSKVLHRDVKPSNIMIDSSGQALLMDFGLARIEHSAGEQKQAEHGLLGTPGYMPPEQISRDYGAIGPHSDQYSLVAVFYELLCGQPPFVGPESVLVANTLHAEPLRPHEKDETIDLDLEAICLKTLAKKPGDRYASCEVLAEDLRRYQADLPTQARPLGLAERFRRWLRRERPLSTALAACGSLLLLLVVALAATAVVLARMYEEKKIAVVTAESSRDEAKTAQQQAEKARDDARTAEQEAEKARDDASVSQRQAVKNLAVTNFRHGHTLCDNGQIPEGLVYLVESLGQAESVQDEDVQARSLASTIRLSLSTWRRQLHDLQAMVPHRLGDQDRRVHCMAVDPRGHFMATVSRSENGAVVWFWDLTARPPRQVQDPIRTKEVIESIAFTHEGHTLASVGTVAGIGCVIRMWRYNETDVNWQAGDDWLTDAQARYRAIAFSPDDTRLVTAGHDGTAGIACEWQVDPRELVCTYYQGPAVPQCIAYGPDGTRLAIGMSVPESGGSAIVTYQVASRQMLWQDKVDGTVYDLAFSHDGKWLAAAIGSTLKGEARQWVAATGDPVGSRLAHLSQVYAVEYSPDDMFILTGSQDRSARLWDRFSGRMLGHPLWHVHEVPDAAFVASATEDAKGPLGVVTVSDSIACVWHVALGSPATANRVGPVVLAGAKIPGREEERIVVAGTMSFVAGKTRVLEESGSPLEESLAFRHERPANCVAAGSDFGLVGLEDGHVFRVDWDARTLQPLTEQHAGSVLCAAMSQDGRYGATAGEDGLTLLWNMETGTLAARLKRDDGNAVNALAFDPVNNCVVLTGGTNGWVRFWKGEAGESIGMPLPHAAAVLCAAYADDGLTLAVGLVGGGQIWHRTSVDADWKRGARLETDTGIARACIWPERQLVATGDLQGNVRFWHVATGEPIGPPLANQGMITVLLGSDADVLSGTSSGSMRRWPLPVATAESQDRLKSWAESITGVRLVQGQTVERLGFDEWQMVRTESDRAGVADIDQLIALLRNQYPPVPRLSRVDGESPGRRSVLQDMVQAFLTETPTFHPPTLEYLDRYLPSDTEALIGLDVRQVIAAPLVWSIGMSGLDLVSWSELVQMLKMWSDVSGFHPLFDVDYVLLAASRGSISLLAGPSPGPNPWFKHCALTVIVKGRFDFERARALARDWPERAPDVAQLLEGPAGSPILQVQLDPLFPEYCVSAALIEEEHGGTLIASLSQGVVERALAEPVAPVNRLDSDFRTHVENTDLRRSLWFIVREEVLHPATLQQFRASHIGDFLPQRIEGSLTVFVQAALTVCTTFRDDQPAQELCKSLRQYRTVPIEGLGIVNTEAEVTGTQLVVKGHTLFAAPPRRAFTGGWREPGAVTQPLPEDEEEMARGIFEEMARGIFEEIKRKSDELGVLSVRDDLEAFRKHYPNAANWDDVRALKAKVDAESWARSKLNVARLLLRNGERDAGIRVLKTLVEDNPDTPAAAEARDELKAIGEGP